MVNLPKARTITTLCSAVYKVGIAAFIEKRKTNVIALFRAGFLRAASSTTTFELLHRFGSIASEKFDKGISLSLIPEGPSCKVTVTEEDAFVQKKQAALQVHTS